MGSRRKRGALDPDYRRKEWRDTAFAPKNSASSISQLALIFALLITAAVYVRFEDSLAGSLVGQGGLILLGVTFASWIIVGLMLRRITRRRVPDEDKRDSYFQKRDEFDINDAIVDTHQPVGTYRDFEHEVAHLFNVLTRYKAVVVGGANDGGVDINLYAGTRLVGIVQCKLYDSRRPLSPSFIRELYASKQQAGVKNAILVTTTHFSKATQKEAKGLGVKLVDGGKLDQMRDQARNRDLAERQTD